jgi:primosomal protein N' (replication factor Y) (superfamily II helicase)
MDQPSLMPENNNELFAEIVFDRPLDQPFTYLVPENLESSIGIGKRVETPFGRGDRATVGYCIHLHRQKPIYDTKSVLAVLDEESLLTEPLLRLTRWMADYYLCGWGQVLNAVLPAGVRDQAGTRQAIYLEPIQDAELSQPKPKLTSKQQAVLDRLIEVGAPIEQKELMKLASCSMVPISILIDKGMVRRFVERAESLRDLDGIAKRDPIPELSADQAAAWSTIQAAMQSGGYHPFLLHGVTGSGKTEVYLRAIEETVKRGQEAIVLVPEISLTPQTIERFRGRCDSIAILHSHLTEAERAAHWRRVAAGKVQVIVGARSAIFAPTKNLGLIIIDEEHESSFKQESTPRYHARDVAVVRASLERIPIVMGSATPALESWHNVHRQQYQLLSLPNRVEDRPLPEVRIIDQRHETKQKGLFHAITPTLETAMNQALKDSAQVMLLLNRRGFATHVHCPLCGHVAGCENCDLALTFHRQRQRLLCHYCGFEREPMQKCPSCNEISIRYQGFGTEKLEAELAEKFPRRVIERMDSDTMNQRGSHERVLSAFRQGAIDILLGTQMIAKGLDFPNVTLVGVINADVGLHLPDFRASERTFQLLAQVAGRTGRGDRIGKVYIQTYSPDHPCIQLAAQHDYLKFAEMELKERHTHLYPPYQRMARVIIRSEKQVQAEEFSEMMAGAFREATKKSMRAQDNRSTVRVLGPAEAPVFRLNKFFRYHFQLQAASSSVLHEVLKDVLATIRPPTHVEFQVDVDPVSML